MAGRRKKVLDIREMVRRLRMGQSTREITRELRCARKTVRKYRKIALSKGWLRQKELPTSKEIGHCLAERCAPVLPAALSSVEPYREKVLRLWGDGVEMMAIYEILREENQYRGSYSSVRRFIRRLAPKTPEAFVRVEVRPGEEAQADFGYAGKRIDPMTHELRKAWVFVMTLSHSRHQYAELVFDQKVETWLALHVRAFEFFGGVPRKCRVDNLKAAITRACFHDPEVQRAYRELAEHYDFTITPCRVRTPRHKGKVEKGGVHYVKRNALAGRTFRDIHEGNEYLKKWCLGRAGLRDHGTTHEAPLARFERAERQALLALPETRYELAVFKEVTLHPDCHVVFDKAYYSAPHRRIGKKHLVRATRERVEIYYQHERVATHRRARYPGERISNYLHYPPEKVAGAMATPVRVKEQARRIGEATLQLVEEMLGDKPVDRLRGAMGVVRLAKKYGPTRLEAACRRALVFGQAAYKTVSSILRQNLENTPLPPEISSTGPVPKRAAFARPVTQIAAHLWRKTWN